jgi:hypothetical protein
LDRQSITALAKNHGFFPVVENTTIELRNAKLCKTEKGKQFSSIKKSSTKRYRNGRPRHDNHSKILKILKSCQKLAAITS